MLLYDFLSIFSRFESKSLILIISSKKYYVRFFMLLTFIFPIYMLNGIVMKNMANNTMYTVQEVHIFL